MNRLYQWLHDRATLLRGDIYTEVTSDSVRTEVTVQEHQRTVFLSGSGFDRGDVCPLCGQTVPSRERGNPITQIECRPGKHEGTVPREFK
jgi:hypothetical protein